MRSRRVFSDRRSESRENCRTWSPFSPPCISRTRLGHSTAQYRLGHTTPPSPMQSAEPRKSEFLLRMLIHDRSNVRDDHDCSRDGSRRSRGGCSCGRRNLDSLALSRPGVASESCLPFAGNWPPARIHCRRACR